MKCLVHTKHCIVLLIDLEGGFGMDLVDICHPVTPNGPLWWCSELIWITSELEMTVMPALLLYYYITAVADHEHFRSHAMFYLFHLFHLP